MTLAARQPSLRSEAARQTAQAPVEPPSHEQLTDEPDLYYAAFVQFCESNIPSPTSFAKAQGLPPALATTWMWAKRKRGWLAEQRANRMYRTHALLEQHLTYVETETERIIAGLAEERDSFDETDDAKEQRVIMARQESLRKSMGEVISQAIALARAFEPRTGINITNNAQAAAVAQPQAETQSPLQLEQARLAAIDYGGGLEATAALPPSLREDD